MLDKSLRHRYSRQTTLPAIGEEGQEKLVHGRVSIIGCGALGSNIAMLLVRAGVGKVKIIDRDFVEVHNLHRQILFDEDDIKTGLPKAIAAARHLKNVNSFVDIEAIVADVNYTNIEGFCAGADVILDGLDNIETRFLVNDTALKLGVPWVYGGAVATTGMTMTIVPGRTPCLRCINPTLPEPGSMPTCETAGILGTVPAVIGALEATEAIKLIVNPAKINRDLIFLDVWDLNFNRLKVERRPGCPACQGHYEFLAEQFDIRTTSLCGQSRAVQVLNPRISKVDLSKLAARLKKSGKVTLNEYMLNFNLNDKEIIVFPDGRAIVRGTTDQAEARELYAKYIAPAGNKGKSINTRF